MSNSMNTELSTASGYSTSNMLFSKPSVGSIPGSVPAINYKRVNISTRNSNGSVGDLIFCTSRLFSFGISPNLNPETQKVNGHVMSLCLWTKDGATEEEKSFTSTFEKVVDRCKEYLLQNKDELELYELEMNDLKKFNPLYWKKEKGQIVAGTGPSLYVKLIESKKQDKILTQFYDYDGNDVNPEMLMGKYCYGNFAIKVESIFIGNKISLQVKLYEAQVQVVDTGMRRLMAGPTNTRPTPVQGFVSSRNDDTNSLKGDDEEDEDTHQSVIKPSVPTKPTTTSTPIVKKTVKRVTKKDDE